MRSLLLLAAAAHAFVPPPHRGLSAPSLRAPQPLREPLPRKPSGVALAAAPQGAPRPDPRFDPFVKLILCVAIDLVGASTYAIPAIGEGFDVGTEPFRTSGTNPLPACSAHTGNTNHVVDAAFDAKTDCSASGAQCATWSRRCKCTKTNTDECKASKFDNKPMSEAWIFQAHVNKAPR